MTYCVRRPGCVAWLTGLSRDEAEAELIAANQVAPGHRIFEEDEAQSKSCPKWERVDADDYRWSLECTPTVRQGHDWHILGEPYGMTWEESPAGERTWLLFVADKGQYYRTVTTIRRHEECLASRPR